VVFLGLPLDLILFLHDANEAGYLPANAVSSSGPAKEICRRGDHQPGIRRTAVHTVAGCQYEIGMFTWTDAEEDFSRRCFEKWSYSWYRTMQAAAVNQFGKLLTPSRMLKKKLC
jgi:hypothetical protein